MVCCITAIVVGSLPANCACLNNLLLSLDSIAQEESGKDQEEQLEEYCTTLEETAAWGGQIELQALAQSLERQILVYSVGLPVVQLGKEYEGETSSNNQRVIHPYSNRLPFSKLRAIS